MSSDFPPASSPQSIALTEMTWLLDNVDSDDVSGRAALAQVAAQLAIVEELKSVVHNLRSMEKNIDGWSKNGLTTHQTAY